MRNTVKNQILEIFRTLYEAHQEIENYYNQKNINNAISLLSDCNDVAVQIGNTIEETEKTKTKANELLENYCDEIYYASVCIRNNSFDDIKKKLNESLVLAYDSINNDIPIINKALMVAYYYPPLAGSGVYRSIKFTKYLSLYNWNATVISTDKPPAGWNFSDKSLENEIPFDINVIRIPDKVSQGETFGFDHTTVNNLKVFLRDVLCNDKETTALVDKISKSQDGLRFLLTFPDNTLLWSYEVVRYIECELSINDYDIIYTTAGPYCSHIIGAYIKNKYGIPWIADYRDQWSANPLIENKNNAGYKLLLQLEKNLLGIATHNITVSPTAQKDYIDRLQVPKERISVITNGYDEADFKDIACPVVKNEKFTLTYSGLLYMQAQSLSPVTAALSELCNENLIDRDKVCIQVIGSMNKMNEDIISSSGFADNFVFRGYLPHCETLRYNVNSDILLLIIGETAELKSSISGKIFDYLRSGRPILALVPIDSDAEKIIQQTDRGHALHFNEVAKIKSFILEEYRKWEENDISFNYNPEKIEKYERKVLTKKLAEIFNKNMLLR